MATESSFTDCIPTISHGRDIMFGQGWDVCQRCTGEVSSCAHALLPKVLDGRSHKPSITLFGSFHSLAGNDGVNYLWNHNHSGVQAS